MGESWHLTCPACASLLSTARTKEGLGEKELRILPCAAGAQSRPVSLCAPALNQITPTPGAGPRGWRGETTALFLILFYLLKSWDCSCAQAPALEESIVLLELLLFPQGQAAEGRAAHAKNSLEVRIGEVVLGPEKERRLS